MNYILPVLLCLFVSSSAFASLEVSTTPASVSFKAARPIKKISVTFKEISEANYALHVTAQYKLGHTSTGLQSKTLKLTEGVLTRVSKQLYLDHKGARFLVAEKKHGSWIVVEGVTIDLQKQSVGHSGQQITVSPVVRIQ